MAVSPNMSAGFAISVSCNGSYDQNELDIFLAAEWYGFGCSALSFRLLFCIFPIACHC
jgi:hypothetical protein